MNGTILLLDNYDSFTYNLLHYVEEVSGRAVTVCRNDEITVEQAAGYSDILLSPGPGLPADAGILIPLIRELSPAKKILGVCMGMQGMALAFGGELRRLSRVWHGVGRRVDVSDPPDCLFTGLEPSFIAGRYHSWVVDKKTLPGCFRVTATDEEGEVMAIRHRQYNCCGVQFHPESILTPGGRQIIRNWLNETPA